MSEPRNCLTVSAPERQKMGKDGSFRDAQVRGGETASQRFLPGLPTLSPFSRVATGPGSCGGWERRGAAGPKDGRTLLIPGC